MYALTITIAAGLLLLALIAGGALLARRATNPSAAGWGPIAGWRWFPSPLGMLVLLPLAGLLLWRVFPLLLFLPVLVPFFWRGMRLTGPARLFWSMGRRGKPDRRGNGNGRPIDGEYRRSDDDEQP